MNRTPSPFEDILGADFAVLPEPVRRLHSLDAPTATTGLSDAAVTPGAIPWLICKLAGLPKTGTAIPVEVLFKPLGRGREHWTRRFGARRYASTLSATQGVLVEHFSIFDFRFGLTVGPKGLCWIMTSWSIFGMPLPATLMPRVECLESAVDGRFHFAIDAAFPMIGHVIHYRGWLEEA